MSFLPDLMRRKLVQQTKSLLISSNRNRFSRFAAVKLYDLMGLVIRNRFASVPGVRAMYLCHGLAAGECYAGLSDFDIVVVFDNPDPRTFYSKLRPRWGSLKRYFPINDLSILTVREFEEWQLTGGGWDPLEEVHHWRLMAGEELRRDRIEATAERVELDRMAWALGHFQNLLTVTIKEEQRSEHMALFARRQLYKCFWNTVHALDPEFMAIATRRKRVEKWIRNHGITGPVEQLEAMNEQRFLSGPVTTLRFEVAALAYQLVDRSLSESTVMERRMYRPQTLNEPLPPSNLDRVEERARAIGDSIADIIGDPILSIVLSGTGAVRGYSLYIILRDGLSQSELVSVMRDLRAVHRVFDDAWFNEHFPAGIPVICSRAMFVARLQGGRSSLHYFQKFRRVLLGPDLFEEATVEAGPKDQPQLIADRRIDWRRERLLYALNLHQICFNRSRAALYDYVTFYLPRLVLQDHPESIPATAEEAVAWFAREAGEEQAEIPRQLLEEFTGRDLDFLLKNMKSSAFDDAWPLLRMGLLQKEDSS